MMSDGANLGVSASVALGKILGGKNIPEDEIKTKEQVRDRITAQFADPASIYPGREWLKESEGGDSYGRAADYLAGAVLAYFTERPEARGWPTDRTYETVDGKYVPVGPDLYGEVKAFAGEAGRRVFEDCTGFMWGWGVNTARWVCDLPPNPNPAIMTIGLP
jgi:hypothetical protein